MIAPRNAIVCLLAALTLCMTPAATLAQDERPDRPSPNPEQVAEHCIEQMQERTEVCVEHLADRSERVVEKIEELLEERERREAFALAAASIEHINRHAQRCVEGIKRQSDRCAALLIKLESPRLARQVKEAVRENAKRIGAAREKAVAEIRDALPDRPDRVD